MIEQIIQIAKENPDGFTIYTETLEHVKKGWVVAIKETQNSFGAQGLEKVLTFKTGTVGGWKEKSLYYFDAVVLFDNEEEATKFGLENEQIAIFNIEQSRLKFL